MADASATASRCGIDSVEIARIERFLAATAAEDLRKLFSVQELEDAGTGPGRAQSLAARFAAKEACLKLFPRETALGVIEARDFSVARDNYGGPRAVSGPRAAAVMGRHRIASISLSLTHDRTSASAVALAERARAPVTAAGRWLYRFLPLRRSIIVANLERVYGATLSAVEIEELAEAHYGHLWQLGKEFLRFRWLSAQQKAAIVRIENVEAFLAARAMGKGVLLLTGHFGNWEVATVAGIGPYPELRGRFHFVRRPIKPGWLDALVTRRFHRAGFGVIGKRGSLDRILDLLAQGDVIVFPFDQHAGPPDGIQVDFFGHPAWTFKSLAILALSTGAPVLPATSWREENGRHVLRFGEPMLAVEPESNDTGEAIRLNTRAFNAEIERMVLARPEQWYWVHRRWKTIAPKSRGKPAA